MFLVRFVVGLYSFLEVFEFVGGEGRGKDEGLIGRLRGSECFY